MISQKIFSFPNKVLCLIALLSSSAIVLADDDKNRLISVDGNATEILLKLGFANKIVAADLTSQFLLNEQTENLGYHRTLSAEGILNTRPDLIIGSNHMGPETTLVAIEKASIPIVKLDSPDNLDKLEANIQTLANYLHAEQEGLELLKQLQTRRQSLQQKLPRIAPKMVFLLDIGDRGLSQAGTDTTGNALIKLLGGDNISRFGGYKSISVEALLAVNPDIILIGSRSDNLDNADNLLERQPLLKHSNAGKNQRIVSVNAATLIAGLSLGALAEAERLADHLYP